MRRRDLPGLDALVGWLYLTEHRTVEQIALELRMSVAEARLRLDRAGYRKDRTWPRREKVKQRRLL